jgi:hypothetical protein
MYLVFHELGYLTVDREIKRDVLTFIYRIENNMLPGYLECRVSTNSDKELYAIRELKCTISYQQK